MSAGRQGGCLCGSVRYVLTAEPLFAAHCHCRTCQRSSGGAMVTTCAVPARALQVSAGEPRRHRYLGDSGQTVDRYFCGDCGTMIYGDPEIAADMLFVSMGSLDESDDILPALHAYWASRRAWDPSHDGLVCFDKLPPQGE